ncbi:hypothetical protein HPB51_027547 [Rhipicephalus microplus]|uniref:Nlr family card domain protein n=1 Tax=Rhipicephalus microplus TaxID=6941 RepID=A0A9J6CZZ3_RHIMP|nr:hypothetical protein HPB51_027547 [Rhipicephalus microplus]
MLLQHLLTHHRCFCVVEINADMMEDHHELIREALRKSLSLRKLKLSLRHSAIRQSQSFAEALPHLTQLRDLELGHVPFDRASVEAFSDFLTSTRSLTTLIITDQEMESEHAVIVIHGLKRNTTITTLSVNASLLSLDSSQCGMMFSGYIRWNKTLRTLTVTSSFLTGFADLRPTMGALSHNTTLFELNLIGLLLNVQSNRVITDMLVVNKTLRRFRMVDCSGIRCPSLLYSNVEAELHSIRSESLWLVALKNNKTLRELHLKLSGIIKPADYSHLFKALAQNSSLKKVILQATSDDDMTKICRALQDTGVPERFSIVKPRHLDTGSELLECTELTCISVACCVPFETQSLHSTVEVDLTFFRNTARDITDPLKRPHRTLLKALSNNKLIRRLSIDGICFDDTEINMMVGILHSSRSLCHLSSFPCSHGSSNQLIRKLSADVASNYTLLSIKAYRCVEYCIEFFAVEDVVRRNLSLVTRGANFVLGKRHKYCAAAAELVQFSSGLVEKVQELALVDENEAVSLIARSLKSFSDLDEFMCLAGVVKCSVVCDKRADGKKQLVDLNHDCWMHIRKYLKVGDILDSI